MTATTLSARAEIEGATVRPFHVGLLVLIVLATLFDGFQTSAPTYVIHFVKGPWGLSGGEAGLLVSSVLVGFGVSALLHGGIADRVGRKPTLVGGLLISGLGSALTAAFAHSFPSFVGLEVLTGLGLGVVLPLGTTYINEYLPLGPRHRLAVLVPGGFSLGYTVSALVGILFSRSAGWQVLFWFGAGAAVLGLLYLVVLPESAEYLAARGRTDRALTLLARVRPDRAAWYRQARPAVLTEPPATSVPGAGGDGTGPDGARGHWRLPLRRGYLRVSVAFWVSSFLLLFSNYGLSAWTPSLMIERGQGFVAGFGFGALLHSTTLLGALLCGQLADRWLQTRVSLAIWWSLGVVATLAVALSNSPAVDVAGVVAAGFFIIGSQGVLNNLCAMSYPVRTRGAGEGYLLGVGRLGGILGPYIGGLVLGATGKTSSLFLAAALACGLAAVSAVLLPSSSAPRLAGDATPRSGAENESIAG